MTKNEGFTSPIGPLLVRFLALKEALGRKYAVERETLAGLDRFLVTQRPAHSELTAGTFAQWCATLSHVTPTVRRNRMRIARNFCLYRQRT
ncbi:MAG: integrase, partial [Gemmatimonadota bacterium]